MVYCAFLEVLILVGRSNHGPRHGPYKQQDKLFHHQTSMGCTKMQAGAERAIKHGLQNRMSFLEKDASLLINDGHAQATVPDTDAPMAVDVVMGLHCCGGLTETALAIAARTHAAFLICTCCFGSNAHLGVLSASVLPQLRQALADDAVQGTGVGTADSHFQGTGGSTSTVPLAPADTACTEGSRDRVRPEPHVQLWSEARVWSILTRYADANDSDLQVRAQACINAMRLHVASRLFAQQGFMGRLNIRQRRFPPEYSTMNIVIEGVLDL